MLTKVKQWLVKYFVPHEHNDHRPHILRARATIAILAIILLIEAGFLTQTLFLSQTSLFATILQNVLIDKTNSSRQGESLSLLVENPLLDAAAKMKAEDMAGKGYFAHTSPEGIEPWHWFRMVGYDYRYAGENLAVNFVDSEDVVKAWLNSPAHRQNIMNRHFTEIGIGTATGMYEGREVVFIVQIFGTPTLEPIVGTHPVVTAFQSAAAAEPATSTASQEMFTVAPGAVELAAVSGVESGQLPSEPTPASTLVQRAIASPKTVSNYLYAALMVIVALALLLNIAIKPRIQHPRLILNGMALLVILNAVLVLNHYLALANAAIF
ncbi:hypothetical protein COU12_02075 [Candidatus Jorgensenbacteria bacterium CG10_big_fil_rev_8_21_14_0_10_54_38]|uniref:SCP domain-containing protein n=1 Tax=Candidatus Jorgensenbacteria bacterium CG10_big_fil_rev_8_21_14_0_10_54_38 TaxID=1974593 RepID=A0A2M6WFP6_9BACT|nr:MAG: hypothetical protein COU12_02075 [Candidatus Jorgensenbacteria bacterium CG10_big_fil_rev_8_21_14_0_10_54_38]